MSLRNILLLVFALVAAGGTALVTRGWIASERAAMAARPKPVPVAATQYVLVAKSNLPVGRFVRAEDFSWQGWPEGALPQGYMVKGKREPNDLVGAVVRDGLMAGEPVVEAKLVKPGERGFMAAVLQPGMRAVSVSVNATSGIAGFVFPGDQVDLLVTHAVKTEGASRKTAVVTETALRDLRVLAVDQKVDDQDNKPLLAKTVTFEATPKQAEMIRIVERIGTLSLTLRSLADEPWQGETQGMVLAAFEQGDASLPGDTRKLTVMSHDLPATDESLPMRTAAQTLPLEGRFTTDAEVSRLIGGLNGGMQKVMVMRGAKSVEEKFRDGHPDVSALNADEATDFEADAVARNTPEEIDQ